LKRDFSVSVTIGASAPVESLFDIERCFSQAKEAVRIKFQLGKGQVILAEDVLQSENCAEYRSDQMLQALKTLLFSGDPAGVDGYVEDLIQTAGGRISEAYAQFACISALNFSQLVLMDLNESLNGVLGADNRLFERLHRMETAVEIKQCMKETLLRIQAFITNRTNLRNRHVVNKIEELVRERYASDLSIGDIAHEIYLSPSYASFIFKQENGVSFTEYLTKFRIDKSREALKDPRHKIYEVAEMVGYNNKSYFCALFKERTGMTPKEYRESLW
jgi:two-component system response regulator YesN